MSKRKYTSKARTRDSDCCSVNYVKYGLHIFNVIFFMSGVSVFAVAMWTIVCKHQYISLLATSNYVIGTYVLLVAGLLSIAGGFVGCCGVWRENHTMILAYTFLLLIVFLLEAIVGGLAYMYEDNITDELNDTLKDTFRSGYGAIERQTLAIDAMQQDYTCCGANRFEDWQNSDWSQLNETEGRLVPDSCCLTVSEGCGRRDHPSNIPYTGCIYKFADELRDHINILAAVGSGICVVQLIGMVLSCCLYVKLRDVTDSKSQHTFAVSPGDLFVEELAADDLSLIDAQRGRALPHQSTTTTATRTGAYSLETELRRNHDEISPIDVPL